MCWLSVLGEYGQICTASGCPHYSLKMPFRNDQLTLPNNLCMVKQRLLGLKRKFWKDELFHKAYNSFITNVIQKGYAEEVPQQQLDCGNGKVGSPKANRS